MAIRIVQSKQNPRIKELRAALVRPGRGEGEPIALEGQHLVAEALKSDIVLDTVFIAQGHELLLTAMALSSSTEVIAVPYELLAEAVTTETPQPIAALARPRHWPWESLFRPTPLIVVLSGIQDPGNLGTILRSAEAFGATGSISLPGTVTRWNPKSMRASAGSVFRLPVIASSENKAMQRLHEAGIQTYAAMAHDAQPVSKIDFTGPAAILIGSEGAGLSAELAAQCDVRIIIPCPGPVESLNAAVAASVLLYEASRQRQNRA